MTKLSQDHAPILEALNRFKAMRVVPFDVPGHKRGKGNPELTEFLGERCMAVDVNSMKPLDNLTHPVSVIKEAEELAADAFGAQHAFLMVGGTTSAVQSMVLTACKKDDKIILPRNVHRSVINALVLCGAVPVYVNPDVDRTLGISLGMSLADVSKAIDDNPGCKSGFCQQSDLLWYLLQSQGNRAACACARHARACRRSARYTFLLRRRNAGIRHGGRRGYGRGQYAQIGRLAYAEFFPADRSGNQPRTCASDHQPDADDERIVSINVQPRYFQKKSCDQRQGYLS